MTADVDALLERVTPRTRLVFIANPNNPTGTYLGAEELARLHAGLPPSVVLAIDAAYAEFVNRNDYEPGVGLVDRADNVVMLRTFSKIYALAGLRLGWAYCPPAIADVLNRVRGPFNVSTAGARRGCRRGRGHGFARPRARPQRPLAAVVLGAARRARAAADAERRQFRVAALSRRTRPQRRGGLCLSAIARHPDPQDGRAMDCRNHLRITIGTGEEMEKVAAVLGEFMARR